MEVLVEHDYIAKEPNELSITKGDVIKDVVKKQDGWWEGTLRNRKGLFPDNFVRVIDKGSSVVLRNKKDAARIRQCRVVFSYKQDHEDELNLKVGDVIDILGEEEEGWWRGLLNGKEGVFPSNFVEEILNAAHKTKSGSRENLVDLLSNNEIVPSLPAKPPKILCEVKFAYKAQNEDELTLKEGDLVTLISKDGQDPGWWKGELGGVIGVFPDNFVTLLPTESEDRLSKGEERSKLYQEPVALKPSAISAQRKSLENQTNEKLEPENSGSKATPPVPSKKPVIPLKKSPSGSSSSGSIFHGLKKKIVDVVDGATGSKNISPPKTEPSSESSREDNVFDDVVRRPLLADVRASRPKAPGRRLPTAIFKDAEPGVVNGNTEHPVMDSPPITSSNPGSSPEIDATDSKPKLREWEKHKAPWLEEMKLNQAKRTSTSPGPEHRLKLTPTDKNITEPDELKANVVKPSPSVFDKEPSPVDTPKPVSTTANSGKTTKTPPNELDKTTVVRSKPNNVPMPSRPQTIHNINASGLNDTLLQKSSMPPLTKISSLVNKTPSPLQRPVSSEHRSSGEVEVVSQKQYLELVDRIGKLEELLKRQSHQHAAAIEELKGKLQVETEMRIELQAKFENFVGESSSVQLL